MEMNVKELVQKLDLEFISDAGNMDAYVEGAFAGDLLSHAMSSVEKGNVWVTVQTNLNILAIASLTEASCIIVASSMNISEETIQKAKDEGICLFRSKDNTYELCNKIGEII